jgi:hypothetical protein
MRFDIYGHYELDVVREGASWRLFKLGPGTRTPLNSVIIPANIEENEIGIYLDDLFHELARPGQVVRLIG